MNTRRGSSNSVLLLLMAVGLACSRAPAEDLSHYDGPALYRIYCASCHGVTGHGDGPVASSLKGEVPDLTRLSVRHGGVFPADQVRKIIDGRATSPPHGSRDMPVWGQAFRAAGGTERERGDRADASIERVLEFLRSIQMNSGRVER